LHYLPGLHFPDALKLNNVEGTNSVIEVHIQRGLFRRNWPAGSFR
jgi:hypothetical protein